MGAKPKIMTLDLETRLMPNKKMVPICMCIYNGRYNLTFALGKS